MKHSRKVIKHIKKLNKVRTKNDKEYTDTLKLYLTRLGYDMDLFTVHNYKTWYGVIYHKTSKTMLAVIKIGYFSNDVFGTYSVKLYREEEE